MNQKANFSDTLDKMNKNKNTDKKMENEFKEVRHYKQKKEKAHKLVRQIKERKIRKQEEQINEIKPYKVRFFWDRPYYYIHTKGEGGVAYYSNGLAVYHAEEWFEPYDDFPKLTLKQWVDENPELSNLYGICILCYGTYPCECSICNNERCLISNCKCKNLSDEKINDYVPKDENKVRQEYRRNKSLAKHRELYRRKLLASY